MITLEAEELLALAVHLAGHLHVDGDAAADALDLECWLGDG